MILDAMGESLAKGERIEIRGFGSFGLNYRPPRTGRNPKSGEKATSREARAAFQGGELRERVDFHEAPSKAENARCARHSIMGCRQWLFALDRHRVRVRRAPSFAPELKARSSFNVASGTRRSWSCSSRSRRRGGGLLAGAARRG
jgi:integration host factor subunit beta